MKAKGLRHFLLTQNWCCAVAKKKFSCCFLYFDMRYLLMRIIHNNSYIFCFILYSQISAVCQFFAQRPISFNKELIRTIVCNMVWHKIGELINLITSLKFQNCVGKPFSAHHCHTQLGRLYCWNWITLKRFWVKHIIQKLLFSP